MYVACGMYTKLEFKPLGTINQKTANINKDLSPDRDKATPINIIYQWQV